MAREMAEFARGMDVGLVLSMLHKDLESWSAFMVRDTPSEAFEEHLRTIGIISSTEPINVTTSPRFGGE